MSEDSYNVVVAGYGQMGHAMETLLAGRSRLSIWAVTPDDLEPPAHIAAAAGAADFLLLCIPTAGHAAVLHRLAIRLRPTTALLSIAKGLDDAERCAADILQGYWDGRPWGVLGGPMIANEIIAGKPAFAELGTHDMTLWQSAQALYPSPGLALSGPRDPQAVSWCGVLKNIYAPLVGVSDELGWGDNARGHIIMAALHEMQSLVRDFGVRDFQAYGDAGLADFVTTVTSRDSHHYALGRRIARGDYHDLQCEGVHSLQVLKSRDGIVDGRHRLFEVAMLLAGDCTRIPQALHGWLAG